MGGTHLIWDTTHLCSHLGQQWVGRRLGDSQLVTLDKTLASVVNWEWQQTKVAMLFCYVVGEVTGAVADNGIWILRSAIYFLPLSCT